MGWIQGIWTLTDTDVGWHGGRYVVRYWWTFGSETWEINDLRDIDLQQVGVCPYLYQCSPYLSSSLIRLCFSMTWSKPITFLAIWFCNSVTVRAMRQVYVQEGGIFGDDVRRHSGDTIFRRGGKSLSYFSPGKTHKWRKCKNWNANVYGHDESHGKCFGR